MKKNFYISTTLFLALLFIIAGCQKSITDQTTDASKAVPDALLENQCRLTRFSYPGFDNSFHYNDKGLADKWKIDYGGGIVDVFTMSYGDNNKLKQAWWYFEENLIATIDFYWIDDLILSEHWDMNGFAFDIANTYDRKGYLIRREASYGIAGVAQYSSIGNLTSVETSFGGELLNKSELTHNIPNRNPFQAIRGLPYGFPFVMLPFNSKWWETSERITIYDAGVPIVIQDPDPAQTTFQFGSQQYLAQANYFDLASDNLLSVPFEYDNCGGNQSSAHSAGSIKNYSAPKKSNTPVPLRLGSPDFIRNQLDARKTNHNSSIKQQ